MTNALILGLLVGVIFGAEAGVATFVIALLVG